MLDDDDLFDEAADEVRTDVEESLDAARAALPDADDVWDVEGDNALGVLNGLKSALDPSEAREAFTDAKKWYTMGQRAGAFEDAEDIAEEMDDFEDLLSDIEGANEAVTDLAGTLPELRSALEEAGED